MLNISINNFNNNLFSQGHLKVTIKTMALLICFKFLAISATAQDYQWAKMVGGYGYDSGKSITLDAFGNVYITGFFENTKDFDPGPGIANLTAVGSYDVFFAKYDANGNYLWAKSFGSPGLDYGWSIAVDATGAVYITGLFNETVDFDPGIGSFNLTSVGGTDIFLARYSTNGDFFWAKSIGGTSSDVGRSIAVDTSGSVYITGSFQETVDFDLGIGIANLTSKGGSDIFFAKYSNNGEYIWAKSVGSWSTEIATSIAIDTLGAVYLTGVFSGTTDFDPNINTASLTLKGGFDVFFAKYTTNGDYIWAKNIGSSNNEWSNSIVVDTHGTLYITGNFYGTGDFDPGPGIANISSKGGSDVFFAKYSTDGEYIWARSMGGTSHEDGYSIAVDNLGSVYVTGYFRGTADFDSGSNTVDLTSLGVLDMFFSKYDSNGNYIWAKSIGGSMDEMGNSIAVDAMGSVYLAGEYTSFFVDFDPGAETSYLTTLGNTDLFIAKYTQPIPCHDTITHSRNGNSGIFTTSFSITSLGSVLGSLTYNAGTYIILLPGFEAHSGTIFEAKIEGCD